MLHKAREDIKKEIEEITEEAMLHKIRIFLMELSAQKNSNKKTGENRNNKKVRKIT